MLFNEQCEVTTAVLHMVTKFGSCFGPHRLYNYSFIPTAMSTAPNFIFSTFDAQNYGQMRSPLDNFSSSSCPGNFDTNSSLDRNSNQIAFPESATSSSSISVISAASHSMLLQNEIYVSLYTLCMRLKCELEAER